MTRLTKLSRSIAGKVALVTGAASSMGRATVHLFADEGAKVAVLDRNSEGVATVVKEITDLTAPIPDKAKETFARRRVPLKRYGEPEEVAHATLSLVLPAASYINGATLVVDGGFTIQNNGSALS